MSVHRADVLPVAADWRGLSRRQFCWLAFASPLAAAWGCAGYHVGARTLYPPDIHTVYVPTIESNSYRRSLGEWLTEAVAKRIEQVTPFKVVGTPEADSVLSCRIVTDRKMMAMESPTDEGRELQLTWQVSVEWVDRQGDLVKPAQQIPAPQSLNTIEDTASLFPELGSSVVSAQQTAIERLARQIVSMMEAPW
ncbi:MAG TPA: LptE family protein [Pirellulales bacterium]|jgi:hypothetical protein|nr:LptE family protein [Pirellulales bacterium]